MHQLKWYSLFFIIILILTGCTSEQKEKNEKEIASSTNITIEPYNLTEKEEKLIKKTGVENIVYFKMNGTLSENDHLQYTVEKYENGKFEGEIIAAVDSNTIFDDTFISFSVSDNEDVDETNRTIRIIAGLPDGSTFTNYPNKMSAATFSSEINRKMTLEKNKPMYLAIWQGSTKGNISSSGELNGELSSEIKKADLAFVYKVTLTDKNN